MDVKKFIATLAMVLLAVLFVPLIPNDALIDCRGDVCDDLVGYISLFDKYFK